MSSSTTSGSPSVSLEIARRDLPNGAHLVAIRNPGAATFAAAVRYRLGRLQEPEDLSGIVALSGECLDEGTTRRDANALSEAVEALGGHLGTGGGAATIQVPEENHKKAIALLKEVVSMPAFPKREVERVRAEVLAAIQDRQDDPHAVASLRFAKEIYGGHPFARPGRGTAETVAAITPAKLRKFHQDWYTPDRAYIAAAGPGDPEAMLDDLASAFRGLKGKAPGVASPADVPLRSKALDLHLSMDKEQVHVLAGHVGVRRSSPDYVPLVVMDHILGSGPGFTSRISKSLRDEQGLCYSVHASISSSAGIEPGLFSAYIGTSSEHREPAIAGFRQEIQRLQAEPPTEEEVQDVKSYLTGSFVFGLERNANLIAYGIRTHRFNLGNNWLDRYRSEVLATTPEDVQRVAQTHLHPHNFTTVSAGEG